MSSGFSASGCTSANPLPQFDTGLIGKRLAACHLLKIGKPVGNRRWKCPQAG